MSAAQQIDWSKYDDQPKPQGQSIDFSRYEEPSTSEKLTRSYNPDVEQFAEKHPVLGTAARYLDAAGGMALGTPGAIGKSIIHPINTVKAAAKSIGGAASDWWNPETRPTWEGIKSVLPEALGQGFGAVGAGEAFGTAKAAALAPVKSAIGSALESGLPSFSKAGIAAKAAPHIEAAGNEVRGSLRNSLKSAEARVEPLYKNLHGADEEELAQSGKSGSVNVSSAQKALEEAKQQLYGQAPAPKAVGREAAALEQFSPNENVTLADLKTARSLRSDLSDAIEAAKDRKTAAALRSARDELTGAMKQRANELGLGNDFETADAQWREIQNLREKLQPLTGEENSENLFGRYAKASPEIRNAVTKLSESGLLDKARVDRLSQLVGRVQNAQARGFMPWIERAAFGAIPLEIAQKTGLVPKLGVSGYMAGGALATLADVARRRIGAVRAIGELPEAAEGGADLGAMTPTKPTMPAPRSITDRAPVAPPEPRSIAPMSEAARLRMQVPLAQQPGPGEEPFRDMLEDVRKETAANPEGEQTERELQRQLQGQSQKTLERNRTREAMQEFAAKPKPRSVTASAKPVATTSAATLEGPQPPTKPAEASRSIGFKAPEASNEQKAQLADLDRRYREANDRYLRARTYDARKGALAKVRAISEQRDDLKQKLGMGSRISFSATPEDEFDPENPKAAWNSLSKEEQTDLSNWAKEIPHLPQSLRESEMSELNRYRGVAKGVSLKELLARRFIKQSAGPREPGE